LEDYYIIYIYIAKVLINSLILLCVYFYRKRETTVRKWTFGREPETNVSRLSYVSMMVTMGLFVCLMVFNTTFNNISVISWRSVLLVEETGRKPPTCRKSLTDFITYCCTPCPERDSNSQHQW
jgi:hypothetical protein